MHFYSLSHQKLDICFNPHVLVWIKNIIFSNSWVKFLYFLSHILALFEEQNKIDIYLEKIKPYLNMHKCKLDFETCFILNVGSLSHNTLANYSRLISWTTFRVL